MMHAVSGDVSRVHGRGCMDAGARGNIAVQAVGPARRHPAGHRAHSTKEVSDDASAVSQTRATLMSDGKKLSAFADKASHNQQLCCNIAAHVAAHCAHTFDDEPPFWTAAKTPQKVSSNERYAQ